MRTRNGESGQSLVLVACALVVLIGILGLAVDMGYLRYVKRELQTAADTAAYAGAMDITYGTVTTAGKAAASENGFADGVNGVTVTINNPPQNGPYAGSGFPTYVEAIITQTTVPTFFSKIFGISNVTLSASSVAAGGLNCIYALDTAAGGAISISASVINSSCGVVDNSNLSGFFAALCAPSIQLKGSNTLTFGGTCGSGFRRARTVKINTAAPDPFANISAPFVLNPPPICSAGTGANPNITADGITISQVPVYCGGNAIIGRHNITITPGTYWGSTAGDPAFLIQNSSVTFQAGTYNIISRTPGTPAIRLQAGFFGGNTVSFGAGTYTLSGGITDTGFGFGSSVNWNNTPNTATLFNINGGGLTLLGNQSNGTGAVEQTTGGVTFYNTGTAGVGAVTSYGPVRSYFDFSGGFCGSKCQLNAPTTGTYAGILFFNDRNNTATFNCGFGGGASGACFDGNITFGSGQIAQAGAYYFPNTKVSFNFDFGSGAPYSFLVAGDINWFLSFTFNRNYTNLPNGSPIKQGSAVIVQ